MDQLSSPTLWGILILVINGGALWIKEWRKNRTQRENGKDLKEIKDKIDCVDKKVGETKVKMAEVQTAVNDQKDQCTKTVTRFDKAISDQGREIIQLAGRKR